MEHSLVLFELMGDTNSDICLAQDIWDWVVKQQLETVKAATIYNTFRQRTRIGKQADLDPALDVLIVRGYFFEIPSKTTNKKSGRPSSRHFSVRQME